MKTFETLKNSKYFVLFIFLITLFAFLVIRTAWVMEDAYITLRTVDNFSNGYGLTWNVTERVQSYTHPFWMLLLSSIYFFTHEGFYTTIVISVICSIAAMVFIILSSPHDKPFTLVGLSILLFSKAFIEYSTSGLENPLSHLLYAIFLYLFFKTKDTVNNKQILGLTLVASLATFNRMDTLLLYIPPLLYLLIKNFNWKTIQSILIGILPLVAWEIFAIIYYGFPLPNTALAKLAISGLGRANLLEQGMFYFLNSIHWDPITLTAIGLGLITAVMSKKRSELLIMVGIVLYFGYLWWIGGDYMSGRFFSTPLLASVIVLNRLWDNHEALPNALVFAFVIILGFSGSSPTFLAVDEHHFPEDEVYLKENDVNDERRWLYQKSSLLFDRRDMIMPYYSWVFRGLDWKETAEKGGEFVHVLAAIGYTGYYSGPNVHIIDRLALAEPLLARLPPKIDLKLWQAGHLPRPIPEGYFETISSGENQIENASLALYYDKLKLIVSGPIWNADRWEAIWKMNTGQYDYLIEQFVEETDYLTQPE